MSVLRPVLVVLLGVAVVPAVAAEQNYAREWRLSLKEVPAGRDEWYYFGPNAAQSVRLEPVGLRITLPVGGGPQGRPGTGLGIPVVVKGDFEITVDFEILQEPSRLQARPGQTRITLDAVLDRPGVHAQSNVATISRRILLWDGPQFFTWLRLWDEPSGKHREEGHGFPAAAKAGRLRLVRTGADVAYYAADGPDAEFRLLHQNHFGTENLRAVQFNAATGGPEAAIDVRLTNLVVRADGLENVPGIASGSTSRWWLVLAAIGVVLCLLGCRAYVGRRWAAVATEPSVGQMWPASHANSVTRPSRIPVLAVGFLIIAVYGCSMWANSSFGMSDRRDLRFIPPFSPFVDANMNRHLGAEYLHIAQSMAAGDGFANPFPGRTGPTAWMPPVLPTIEAALLWFFNGKLDSVMAAVVFLQISALIVSGLLVIAIARRTVGRLGAWAACVIFLLAVACDFHAWFQMTHDAWIVLLALDLVLAAVVWGRPMTTWKSALLWGCVGGFCALVSPIVGFVWSVLTIGFGIWSLGRSRSRLALAVVAAGVVVAPWTVRNYAVFGRLIPVKSNAAYELYQSQCLTSDGLIRQGTFASHPNNASAGRERQEYQQLGEMAFLDRKNEQFWEAVKAKPQDFLDRVADRLFATTVWYVPFNREDQTNRPVAFWISRLAFPLPFLAAVFLLATAGRRPLHRFQWVVVGVYIFYLLPYIAVSFYLRYYSPLVAVNALLVVWAVDRLVAMSTGRESVSEVFRRVEPNWARPAATDPLIPAAAEVRP